MLITIQEFLRNGWTYALSFPTSTILALAATLTSIVALTFVLSRTKGLTSNTLSEERVSDEDIEKRTDEVVRIVLKKEFLKDLVRDHLEQRATKPRFTFKEFMLYGMPAVVTLALVGVTVYLIILKPDGQLPAFLAQAFTAVIGYYFGAAATRA